MDLVELAVAKLDCSMAEIFADTYAYWETPRGYRFVMRQMTNYHFDKVVPEAVKDYCLDILANRAVPFKRDWIIRRIQCE